MPAVSCARIFGPLLLILALILGIAAIGLGVVYLYEVAHVKEHGKLDLVMCTGANFMPKVVRKVMLSAAMKKWCKFWKHHLAAGGLGIASGGLQVLVSLFNLCLLWRCWKCWIGFHVVVFLGVLGAAALVLVIYTDEEEPESDKVQMKDLLPDGMGRMLPAGLGNLDLSASKLTNFSFLNGYIDKVNSILPKTIDKVNNILPSAMNKVNNLTQSSLNAAHNVVSGTVDKVNDLTSQVGQTANKVASGGVNAVNKLLGTGLGLVGNVAPGITNKILPQNKTFLNASRFEILPTNLTVVPTALRNITSSVGNVLQKNGSLLGTNMLKNISLIPTFLKNLSVIPPGLKNLIPGGLRSAQEQKVAEEENKKEELILLAFVGVCIGDAVFIIVIIVFLFLCQPWIPPKAVEPEDRAAKQKSIYRQSSNAKIQQIVAVPVDRSVGALKVPQSKIMSINGIKPKNMSGEMQFQIQINLNLNFDQLNENNGNDDDY